MTYLSAPDRRSERESAEERRVEISVEAVRFGRMEGRPWCSVPIRRHRPEALARCEAAFQAEMNRRLAGPLRARDAAGREA